MILILVVQAGNSAEIIINKLDTEAGYVIVESQPVTLIQGYSKLIHVIHLKDIEDTINKVKISVSSSMKIKHGWMILNLQKDIEELEHSLLTIGKHENRGRRALIDVGGRIIKWVFGNLNDEDKQEIDNHFRNIDINQHNIINNLNKQITINDDIRKYMLNVKLILESHKVLFNGTHNIELENKLELIKYNHLTLLISKIKDKIERIQDNIMSSKHQIMNRFFLTTKEIDFFRIDSDKLRYVKCSLGKLSKDVILFVVSIPIFFYK